ncbi:MAG: sensor histidine kinase [Candidatus Dojkabacteria bacterium]
MSNLDLTKEPNPFNFVPMPLEIEDADYPYWMAFLTEFIEDQTATLVHLYGHPNTFSNQSFDGKFGETFPSLTLDYLFEQIVQNSNLTAEELIEKVTNGEIIKDLNFDLQGDKQISVMCNLLPLRLGNKIVGYKFQILNNEVKLKNQLDDQLEVNRLMRIIFSGVSHDSKNNATTINTSVYLIKTLLLRLYGKVEPELLRKLNTIEEQAKIASRDIDEANNNLIATSEFNQTMEWFSLRAEIENIKAICEALVMEKPKDTQVTIEVNVDKKTIPFNFKLFTNKKGLYRVLVNLIGNAIKYSKENFESIIKVSFRISNNQLQIEVQDNGIGIPSEFSDVIFRDFGRADNVTGKQKGTGIGLMIVKTFIDNMYGTIDYKSELNVGTTFTIKLPLDMHRVPAGYLAMDEL